MQYRDKKSNGKNSTIIVVILALYSWYYDLKTSTLFMEKGRNLFFYKYEDPPSKQAVVEFDLRLI